MVLVHHKTSSDDNPDGEDSDDNTGRILNAEDLPHLESRSAILEIPPSAVSFFLYKFKYLKIYENALNSYHHRMLNLRASENKLPTARMMVRTAMLM